MEYLAFVLLGIVVLMFGGLIFAVHKFILLFRETIVYIKSETVYEAQAVLDKPKPKPEIPMIRVDKVEREILDKITRGELDLEKSK